ncbi:MAG: cobalt ECF transporter T component CbiQ [Phycisphaerae bacterium]|nr:cobalt ECF transporter T component CbiQ [Phycisphaerae bacterium]
MSKTDSVMTNLGCLDTLARQDSPIHRLDPRTKLLTTLVFIVMIVSFDKYQISAMLPFAVFPVVLIVLGNLPAGYLMKRVLWVAPFAMLVGIFNPLLDRQALLHIGTLEISGGWVSFASILIRFFLTVLAAFVLVATTGFNTICLSLEKIGVPNVFVMQLLFLYRYAFVLAEESSRMLRAWQLRAPLRKAMSMKTFSTVLGSLFLRTTGRAQRIYQAMCCRGFEGQLHPARRFHWRMADTVFLFGFCLLFAVFRFANPAVLLGKFVMGIFS